MDASVRTTELGRTVTSFRKMKCIIIASQPEVILPFWTASFHTTESSSWILECSTRSSANRIQKSWTTPARCLFSRQILPTLFAELVKERKGAKSLYVLHMENGKPLSKSSLKCLLQMIENRTVDNPDDLWTTAPHSKVIRTLDFHVHPHQLRHTYITRLFESGLDIKEIQYLAGHATVNMTLRVYTHYQHESRQQSTAQKVCAAFG